MCVCVLIAVNSHACYIWIVNDMTDSDIWLLFLCFRFLSFITFWHDMWVVVVLVWGGGVGVGWWCGGGGVVCVVT